MWSFAELAAAPDPSLDELALALAAEFRTVDREAAIGELDALGAQVATAVDGDDDPLAQAQACARVLGGEHGFLGDAEDYDHPDNSMLDVVLERRRGLPILLSAVYTEVARRAGVPLAGVGLPGHFVVAHFGAVPPVVLDPFSGGFPYEREVDSADIEPWTPSAIALRMLNNLVLSFQRRGDLTSAIHAAGMRLALPADDDLRALFEHELRLLRAQLS
ncbi:MAG TPA: transglutaminase-like domain-containing protein [Baekduia sp.]|nr:transglutaminase-like domain-containing protein [Baekduia sp.]